LDCLSAPFDHEPNLNAEFPLRSALRCNKGSKPPLDILGPWAGLRTGILIRGREQGEGLWPAFREPQLVDQDRRKDAPLRMGLGEPIAAF
jgi:hypothetical protein